MTKSALGRSADVVLCIPNSNEAAHSLNAPTTSTTLQMALGDALAVALLDGAASPWRQAGTMLHTVGDLMHGPNELPIVGPDAPMREAVLELSAKRFGCVGVISDGDLRRKIDGLLDHSAGEVMTRAPKTVPKGMLAAEALKHMTDTPPPTTLLFVVENEKPVRILHVHDLLGAGVM